MIASSQLGTIAGSTMVDQQGHKIGKIVDVYESTDGPEGTFVTVSTGLFGGGASFVPLAQANLDGKNVVVPYSKDLVKDAPRVEADQELTSDEEDRLYRHYQLTGGTDTTTSATTTSASTAGASNGDTSATTASASGGAAVAGAAAGGAAATPVPRGTDRDDLDGDGVYDDVKDTAVGRDTSGLTTDDAMTRSEERLQVGTQTVESGRARLRKRIVSEQVSEQVSVSHDEVKVVREPITAANMPAAMDGPALSEEEHEVVLQEQVPVVAKETVAVERVRLGVDTVQGEQTVSEQVRKEQIETDLSDVKTTRDTSGS